MNQIVANYISRDPLDLRNRKTRQPARQTEDGFYALFLFERPEHAGSDIAGRPYHDYSHAEPLPYSPTGETLRSGCCTIGWERDGAARCEYREPGGGARAERP